MATTTVRRRKVTDRKFNTFQRKLANYMVVPAVMAVVVTLLAVSLEHLATGIATITHSPVWQGWAMAIAIDVGMVAAEVASITLGTVIPASVIWSHRYVIAVIVASMVLNVMAFWVPNGDMLSQGLAISLGIMIPAAVYSLTRLAGGIWLAANRRKGGVR